MALSPSSHTEAKMRLIQFENVALGSFQWGVQAVQDGPNNAPKPIIQLLLSQMSPHYEIN
jgi:hypothetical protein